MSQVLCIDQKHSKEFSELSFIFNYCDVLCAVLTRSVVSDSLQPHGLQPTRLLCPWNSSDKNTGMDCHALLRGFFPTQG